MESKHQTTSVILKLMGLDEVPPQHPARDGQTQKVLSEKYLQKVASIGVRKKCSSHQHHSFRMNTDEKEEYEGALKVVKTIRRDKHHKPSKGNSGRMIEQGNLQLQQKTDNGLQDDVHGEAGLYGTFRFLKSQLDLKDETFNSRIVALKANTRKAGNGSKYFSFPSSCKNSRLADGLLKEIFCPKSIRVYPEMKDRKKMSYHMDFGKQSSRSFSKVSKEVSVQIGNESFAKSWDMMKPASNISGDEIQCNSLFFCSDGSYVGSKAKNRTLKQRNVTEILQEVGQCRHGSTHHQYSSISAHGNGARNFSYQSGFSKYKVRRNVRYKVGVTYSFARKVATTRPLCAASVIADNCRTMTKDNLFQKYWGLRKNAHSNWSIQKSKNQYINQKDCSEYMNLGSGSEKFSSFSSYFNSNHIEENCIGLYRLKKRCYKNDVSDKKPMFPQLSRSGPSPISIDSQILQETCLMDDEVKNTRHEGSNKSKQDNVSPNSSVDCLVSDAKIEVIGRSNNNQTKQKSKSTAFVLLCGDSDSLSHASYASTQQDTSEFQEDSVYSLCYWTEPDSLGSFEAYEPSPISVLDHSLRDDDISSSSECLKVVGTDSSEEDDEGFGFNVSTDEDCGDESQGDFKEDQDLVGLFRAEESRDFSYVVEVLTEAGSSNRSLFTDFSTWHSADCPISPSVFEILEKKFGEQQLWKRSERRLLFDRINLGLLEILQPCSYTPTWEKPMSRRLNAESSQDMEQCS